MSLYYANDKYSATLRTTWIASPADTTLAVTAIPDNFPTLVTVGWNTDVETVFSVTGSSGDSPSNYALTGVVRVKGANENLPADTAVNCLNHEEFFNQYLEIVNEDYVRLVDQAGDPATPDTGKSIFYIKDGQAYTKDDAGTVTPITIDFASAAEVTTGTEAAKIISPKALKDAGIVAVTGTLATDALWDAAGDLVQATGANAAAKLTIGSAGDILRVVSGAAAWTGANFKVGADTRNMTAATGAVAYTGVGFQPKAVIFLAVKSTTTLLSIGFDDVTTHNNIQFYGNNTASFSTTKSIAITDGAASQDAYISAVGSDGFTLTWTKTASPTGTANFFYLCLR